jgi:hypothetical protein
MVYKVRDEADIIEANLRFHRAQGVDFFVIADNGSTDGTLEILERYEAAGLVRLERTNGGIHDMKGQGGGEEAITRIASEMGADWVIHNDADEFWWPTRGTLKDLIAQVQEPFGMVLAPRTEFVARPGDGPFPERMTIREAAFRRPPKSAHRATTTVSLRGPHPVEIWSGDPYRGLVGRPVLRTAPEHREEAPLDLVIAPEFQIGVLHFPVRSFEQYRRRVEIARDDGYLERSPATRGIRDALAEGRLEDAFERIVLDEAAIARGLEDGWLVEQTSFRDYLAACPDPLEDAKETRVETPSGGGGPTPDDLRDDAMYAISRYLQTQGYRAQKRRNEGAERRQAQRELWRRTHALRRRTMKLRRLESSLWWRLRPRLPQALLRRRKSRRG